MLVRIQFRAFFLRPTEASKSGPGNEVGHSHVDDSDCFCKSVRPSNTPTRRETFIGTSNTTSPERKENLDDFRGLKYYNETWMAVSGGQYAKPIVIFFGEEDLWIATTYNIYAFNATPRCNYQQGDRFGAFHLTRDPEEGVVNAVFPDSQCLSPVID